MTDDREIVDQESIANVLNEIFANIGSNLAGSIPSVTHTAREFMSPPICDSLLLSPAVSDICRLQTADCRLQTTDCRLQITDCIQWTSDRRL